MRHVVLDLLIGERGKGHVATTHKGGLLLLGCQRHTRIHLVRASTEAPYHGHRLGLIGRLSEHLFVETHDGIGRDDEFVSSHRLGIGIGFGATDIGSHFTTAKRIGIRFIDVAEYAYFVGISQSGKQFLAAG